MGGSGSGSWTTSASRTGQKRPSSRTLLAHRGAQLLRAVEPLPRPTDARSAGHSQDCPPRRSLRALKRPAPVHPPALEPADRAHRLLTLHGGLLGRRRDPEPATAISLYFRGTRNPPFFNANGRCDVRFYQVLFPSKRGRKLRVLVGPVADRALAEEGRPGLLAEVVQPPRYSREVRLPKYAGHDPGEHHGLGHDSDCGAPEVPCERNSECSRTDIDDVRSDGKLPR